MTVSDLIASTLSTAATFSNLMVVVVGMIAATYLTGWVVSQVRGTVR